MRSKTRLAANILRGVLLITAAAAYAQSAQPATANILGDWQGKLVVGSTELRLVLHVSSGLDGSLRATLDSVDQGANGIPVTSISFDGTKLVFASEPIHGSYTGTLDTSNKRIDGTWTQGQPLPLNFERKLTPAATDHKSAKSSDIDGDWVGDLDTGAIKLRIVFHIVTMESGLTATMDSPDQGAKGLPVTTVVRDGSSLKMEMKQLDGVFSGKIKGDLSAIEGTWTQGGHSIPLLLKRAKNAAELERKRPQEPVRPYPYRERDVKYSNKTAAVELAGTLTIPRGTGPFPAVLLITGSGPQDRDETLLGHKPFLVLSDYLTRRGIAVLRADDRGVGKSTGNFSTATTADFATDAEAGVAFLKTQGEVDPHKIGLIGHSEGGVIAPMVAARNPDVAFIVMLAGTGVPGDQVIIEQTRAIATALGKSPEEVAKTAEQQRDIAALLRNGADPHTVENKLHEELGKSVSPAELGAQIQQLNSRWFRYFINYDPAPALRRVKCPVLALIGQKDMQVLPQQNLPAIRKALQEGGNKNFEVVEIPGLNHLFQTAKTGSPVEYAGIEETMAPIVLQRIADWVLQTTQNLP